MTETPDIKTLKITHDYYLTIEHVFKTRVQWYHEEFQGVQDIISFASLMTSKLKQDIDSLEPKKEEDATPKPKLVQ